MGAVSAEKEIELQYPIELRELEVDNCIPAPITYEAINAIRNESLPKEPPQATPSFQIAEAKPIASGVSSLNTPGGTELTPQEQMAHLIETRMAEIRNVEKESRDTALRSRIKSLLIRENPSFHETKRLFDRHPELHQYVLEERVSLDNYFIYLFYHRSGEYLDRAFKSNLDEKNRSLLVSTTLNYVDSYLQRGDHGFGPKCPIEPEDLLLRVMGYIDGPRAVKAKEKLTRLKNLKAAIKTGDFHNIPPEKECTHLSNTLMAKIFFYALIRNQIEADPRYVFIQLQKIGAINIGFLTNNIRIMNYYGNECGASSFCWDHIPNQLAAIASIFREIRSQKPIDIKNLSVNLDNCFRYSWGGHIAVKAILGLDDEEYQKLRASFSCFRSYQYKRMDELPDDIDAATEARCLIYKYGSDILKAAQLDNLPMFTELCTSCPAALEYVTPLGEPLLEILVRTAKSEFLEQALAIAPHLAPSASSYFKEGLPSGNYNVDPIELNRAIESSGVVIEGIDELLKLGRSSFYFRKLIFLARIKRFDIFRYSLKTCHSLLTPDSVNGEVLIKMLFKEQPIKWIEELLEKAPQLASLVFKNFLLMCLSSIPTIGVTLPKFSITYLTLAKKLPDHRENFLTLFLESNEWLEHAKRPTQIYEYNGRPSRFSKSIFLQAKQRIIKEDRQLESLAAIVKEYRKLHNISDDEMRKWYLCNSPPQDEIHAFTEGPWQASLATSKTYHLLGLDSSDQEPVVVGSDCLVL